MTTLASPAVFTSRSRLPRWLPELFAIDVRGLAFLRVSMALVLIYDTIFRSFALTAHYTDEGILTRAALRSIDWDFTEPWWMSLHMLHGSTLWAGVLAGLSLVSAGCLLLGYRSKWALAASWLLLYSVQARFPLLLQGGDVLLRCALVWMLFLPLDARWSVAAGRAEIATGRVSSPGTAAMICQLLVMYFFSALLKTSPLWTENFHATWFALRIDHFTSPLGYVVADYPQLLQVITAVTLVVELTGPLLLFVPWKWPLARWCVPLVFIGFHLGLVACLDLGTFPWICILCWTCLLPAPFWDGVEQLAAKHLPVLYQGPSSLTTTTTTSAPVQPYGSRELNLVAGFLLLYMLLLNVAKLQHPFATVGPPPLGWLAKITGLNQYWNMFAPGPYQYSSWLRVEGELADGRLVNLYDPAEPLADRRPPYVSGAYPTQYWRRCMVMAFEFAEPVHQEGIVRYFRDRWNREHSASEQVVKARYVHMVERLFPPTRSHAERCPVERRVLHEWVAQRGMIGVGVSEMKGITSEASPSANRTGPSGTRSLLVGG